MKLQLLDKVPDILGVAVISSAGKLLYQSKTKNRLLSTSFCQRAAELCEDLSFDELEVVGETAWFYLRHVRKSDILVVVASRALAAATLRLKCELAIK